MPAKNLAPLWWDIFIVEYLKNGQNAAAAYRHAKPNVTDGTAAVESFKLLTKPNFKARLEKVVSDASLKVGMSLDQWLNRLCHVACFDIRKYIEVDDSVHLVDDWKARDDGHALQKVKFSTMTLKNGAVLQNVELVRDDKMKAMEMLGKSLGYLKDKVELSGNVAIDVVDPYALPAPEPAKKKAKA